MKKKTVCLVCGGQSTEHQVSLLSAINVTAAIPRDEYDVLVVGIDQQGGWHWYPDGVFHVNGSDADRIALAPGGIPVFPVRLPPGAALVELDNPGQRQFFEVLFPVLHGANGEDGAFQGLAQMLNCPCVGCGIASSAICMDKAITKRLLNEAGIRTARGLCLRAGASRPECDEIVAQLGLPVFVKPAGGGSSVGASKATSAAALESALAEAFQYDEKVLVEEYVVGREIECAVLGNRELFCAVPGEVIPKVGFYSYEAKYTMADGAELRAPADLTPAQVAEVQALAKRVYEALDCEGMARVDFFLRADGVWVLNEVNTIPGFTSISMYPRLHGLSGISYSDLVRRLLQLCIDKHDGTCKLIRQGRPSGQ
ncbi:MAG: D-alanine--D-alanine ligase [Lentisphaerae bacterium]|jgi:D-alanine-D-alanine ligase|nr:D-alanine--D-alanine ligase [Lentisphaerota bacterium]